MRRLNILIWHIHGSYLHALTRAEHNWFLPVKAGQPVGYSGRDFPAPAPDYVVEIPAAEVRSLPLDLIIYQSPKNWLEDGPEILSAEQQRLPRIYLEHNPPFPDPINTRHVAADSDALLVQVTHYNRLMWDSGSTPAIVIEHSVAIDPSTTYSGHLSRGITVINEMQRRARKVGFDVFQDVRQQIPLDIAGMQSEAIGGIGDIPYDELHRRMAAYRFLFNTTRYTSLQLAVIEAMLIGMPVVALATTEIATVIQDGETGYVSCNVKELIDRMKLLLADPAHAQHIGANGREMARQRFGLERFVRDWNAAFGLVTGRKL